MREDWVEVELGEVCAVNMGQSPPSSTYNTEKKGLPFFQGKAEFTTLHPVVQKWCSEPKKIAEVDDILLSVRAPVGTTNVANQKCAIGRGLATITYTPYKYILYYLKLIERKLDSQGAGTTFKAISGKVLKSQIVPIAPLPEQRAIAAKIEQLFSELDNGTANLKTAKDKLEIYRQAVLKKAFEGELTKKWRKNFSGENATELYQKVVDNRKQEFTERIEKWTILTEEAKANDKKKPAKPKKPVFGAPLSGKEIEDLNQTPSSWKTIRFIGLIQYKDNGMKRGPFGSAIKKAFFVPSGYKVYEQKNAINDNSSFGSYYLSEKKYKELERFSVKGGDYIVSCSGTIGRIHKLDADCKEGVINQALLKIVLDESLMISKYFLYLFRSGVFQRKILRGTRGTGMQNLASVDEIKVLPIQLPSINEQHQIIQEIETRLSVCDNTVKNINEALKKSEGLRQSILKKAFEGKLLNDSELQACRKEPDWEPAERLLERIKKEKK